MAERVWEIGFVQLRDRMLKQMSVICIAVAATASLASAGQILTPGVVVADGDDPGPASWSLVNAFSGQPTLSGGVPTGGDTDYNYVGTAPAGSVAYLDFGSDWASYQIEQTWTKALQWKWVGANPFAEVAWDNDTNPANGTLGAAGFNFLTHGGGAGVDVGWQLDTNASGSPIALQARYVKMVFGGTPSDGHNELAIIASQVPEPATLGLVGAVAMGLLVRRRRYA